MVAIITFFDSSHYRLFKRETYKEVLEAYLRRSITESHKIILIYDLNVKRTIFKSRAYNEHYQILRDKLSRKLKLDYTQALVIYKFISMHHDNDLLDDLLHW